MKFSSVLATLALTEGVKIKGAGPRDAPASTHGLLQAFRRNNASNDAVTEEEEESEMMEAITEAATNALGGN